MTTISIEFVKQNWPEAAAKLSSEGELMITDGGIPFARLLSVVPQANPVSSERFDPEAHLALLKELDELDQPGVAERVFAELESDRSQE